MLQVGLSTLYLYMNGANFESVPAEVASDNPQGRPAFWELVDEGAHKLSRARTKLIKDLAAIGYKFSIHAPFREVDLSSLEAGRRLASIRRIKESIDAASEIEASYIVVHPGGTKEGVKEALIEGLFELFDYASSRGIKMGIENMPPIKDMAFVAPDEFLEFYKTAAQAPQLVLDVAHAYIAGFLDHFIQKLTNRVLVVHCSDTNGLRDDHLKIGAGVVPWRTIISQMLGLGFAGNLSVESIAEPYASVSELRDIVTNILARKEWRR
ncbi:MAG: hypothetical protein C4339_01020 [Nitrososphaerota archaeon]